MFTALAVKNLRGRKNAVNEVKFLKVNQINVQTKFCSQWLSQLSAELHYLGSRTQSKVRTECYQICYFACEWSAECLSCVGSGREEKTGAVLINSDVM